MAAGPADAPMEVVERKGLGHPDTICDALAEQASRALSRHYVERFGVVLHHNVDKVLLVGGQSRTAFGGGEVLEPIDVILAGRATREVEGVAVPVDELAVEACRSWLREHFRTLEPDVHVRLHPRIRPGSADLVDLFMRQARTGHWLANDTSIGVGFAPMTRLERAVLEVERHLRSERTHAEHPELGEDIKVMGVRRGGEVELTVADAFVDRWVPSLGTYREQREALRSRVAGAAEPLLGVEPAVHANAADDLDSGSVYLTVTGTSAESGDDGEAGRGNRHSGLITPYRPMTMESVAGKNPVSHVGKIYNVAAMELCQALVEQIEPVTAATCVMVSRIGGPVNEPAAVHLRIGTDGTALDEVRALVQERAEQRIASMTQLWRRLVDEPLAIY